MGNSIRINTTPNPGWKYKNREALSPIWPRLNLEEIDPNRRSVSTCRYTQKNTVSMPTDTLKL